MKSFELPSELEAALAEKARQTGRPEDDLILEALRAFLLTDPKWPRSIGIAESSDLNAADIDDWLKANWRPDEDWGRT